MGMLSSIVIIFSLLISLLSLQLSDAQFITGKEKGRFKQGGGALSFDGGMAAEVSQSSQPFPFSLPFVFLFVRKNILP